MVSQTHSRTPVTAQKPLRPLQSNSPKTQYLIIYNFVSFLAWLVLIFRLLILVPTVGYERVYAGLGTWARWTQLFALMDIVHAATGLVRAPLLTTFLQTMSRMIPLGIAYFLPQIPSSTPIYSSMLLAHCSAEIIRYSFFTLQLSGFQPAALKWLRYSAFYVLYPIGISSEMWLMWQAIGPAGKAYGAFWDVLMSVLLGIVWPGSTIVLFGHMMKQRGKMIGQGVKKKA